MRIKFLVLSFALCALHFTLVFAQPVSSEDLIKNALEYDGKTVVYEGELIGDIMKRKEFAWVNVKEGESAIGIWIHRSLLQDVAYTGSYKSKGDTVEVTGIFHRACPEHGGDLDIHAETLDVTGRGRTVTEKMNPDKKNMAVMLLGALCLVWISSLFIRK
ncbi:MAG: DNA-binding protein [Candidatus Omnitrophota bacterium]